VAGYGVAVPVGGIGALLVGLTARTSFRVGASAALGVATADGLYALAAILGGAALTRVIAPIASPMHLVGAVVLAVIAVRTAVTALRRDSGVRDGSGLRTPGRAYLALLGLTVLNPATVIYFAALVLGRQSHGGPGLLAGALFVVAAFLASASWQLVLAGGGSLVGRILTGPRGRLVTALVSSAVILGLAITLALGV
jgi:arginine exporter protein ArgO